MFDGTNVILVVSSTNLTNKNFVCSICGKNFSRKFVLKRHLETIHGQKWVRKGEVLMNFATFSDFKLWKECEEKKTKSIYVKARGEAIRKNGNKVIQYRCYRSGVYKSKGNGKRKLKANCSKKIGTVCPAQIWVKIVDPKNSTKVFVRYRPKHENHDPESEHLNSAGNEGSSSKKKRRKIKRNNTKKKDITSSANAMTSEAVPNQEALRQQQFDEVIPFDVNLVVKEEVVVETSDYEEQVIKNP